MSWIIAFIMGGLGALFLFHRLLKKTFAHIPYPVAMRFQSHIYASPSFPHIDVPEGYELLESPYFLFLQEKHIESSDSGDFKHRLHMLETIVDALPIAIWYRSSRARLLYCNASYAEVFQCSTQKILAESLEILPDLALKALKSRQSQIKRTYVVLSGERRYLEVAELHAPQGLVGYAIDLSDMDEKIKAFTRQLYANEEVLNHLSSPIAIYGEDMRLIFYNQAYLKQFGFTEGWLKNKPTLSDVLDFLREQRKLPEYSDFREHKQERLKLFKDVFQPIHELIHQPDGRALRLIIMPYPLGGIVYIFEDVTEKLALEQGYNTLMAVQEITLDYLYEGILVLGTDYKIRLCNQALKKLWNTEELTGKHLNDLKLSTLPVLEMMNNRQHTNGVYTASDHRHLRYTYVPLPDGAHLFSFVDVSDHFNAEQALQEKAQILEHVDRLKSHFVSHVSHELKNPLKKIKNLLPSLEKNDTVKNIHVSVDQLMNLINAMLDLAHIEAGQLSLKCEKVEIRSFLSGVADLVRGQLDEHKIELFMDIHTTHQYLHIDARRLRHAIFHLLKNAIQYTKAGGRVILRAKDLFSNRIEIVVEDNGEGISYAKQKYIFDHSSEESIGLGLPLVKNLIELHGGEVILTSAPGKGTCVRCILNAER